MAKGHKTGGRRVGSLNKFTIGRSYREAHGIVEPPRQKRRKTGGRKAGTPNKKTRRLREIRAEIMRAAHANRTAAPVAREQPQPPEVILRRVAVKYPEPWDHSKTRQPPRDVEPWDHRKQAHVTRQPPPQAAPAPAPAPSPSAPAWTHKVEGGQECMHCAYIPPRSAPPTSYCPACGWRSGQRRRPRGGSAWH
jgi:hypothetical protein